MAARERGRNERCQWRSCRPGRTGDGWQRRGRGGAVPPARAFWRPGGGPAEEGARSVRAAGGEAQIFAADLADPAAPGRLVDEVQAALGPVDVLAANAGFSRRAGYEEVDAALFDETLAVNLRAPFLLAQRTD